MSKKVSLRVLLLVAFVIWLFAMCYDSNKSIKQVGVVSWLSSLSEGNFDECDLLIENVSERLYSNQVLEKVSSQVYYDTTLINLASCIESIQVLGVNDKNDALEYEILVKYKPYLQISELVYDESALNDLKDEMQSGKYNNSDIKSELEELYFDIFQSSCFKSTDEIEEKVLVLTEQEKNGVVYISGTVDFINTLLKSSNIKENVLFYEENVKDVVETIIRANNRS